MGQIFAYPGIERLFDKSFDTIDLREYIKKKFVEHPVFIGITDIGQRILLMNYLDDIWYLGNVKEKNFLSEKDTNNGIIITDTGRKYIVFYFLDEFPYQQRNIKVLDRYLV